MHALVSDLRYAIRALARSPGFATLAVLVLALGIGLNTAVFSLVNMVLLRPLPGDSQPGQVAGLFCFERTKPDSYQEFSYPNYVDIRDRNEVFSHVAAHTLALVGVGEGEMTRRVFAFLVTANYFSTFGVRPAVGRAFLPEEERPGAARLVVIVSNEYWRKMGADPALVGKTMRINGRSFTVVGIAPRGFAGPTTLISPAVWLPTGVYEIVVNDLFRQGAHNQLADRANHAVMIVGRLKPGVTLASAEPSLKALGGQMEKAFPGENRNLVLQVHRLARTGISTNPQDDHEFISTFALLMAMSAVVLLIACMNLANMLLARASSRRREIAVRLSMGANRGRIVRQLLTEGFMLSLLGGAAGLLLTSWALGFFAVSIDPMLPLLLVVDPRPDVRVLGATTALAVLSTLAFGLGPAVKLARTDVVTELKEGDRSGARGRVSRFGFRHVLVVGQIALSLALLTAAGLFARGAFNASKAEPGFKLDRSLLVSLDPSLVGMDEVRGRELYRRLLERVRTLPGVETASLASVVPFGDFTEGRQVQRVGAEQAGGPKPAEGGGTSLSYGAGPTAPSDRNGVGANYYVIGRDYFQALGIPILRGRGFTEGEEQPSTGPRVVIVDEPLARRLFQGADPLGQYIYFPGRDEADTRPLEVVGIVGGTRHSLFDREPGPHVFVPFGQRYRGNMNLHIRTASSGPETDAAMLRAVRQQVRSLDERVPIIASTTMREYRDRSMSAWIVRAGANLFSVFGGLAVFLAVVGVYGVRAYLVSRRTREIGIRVALGAAAGDVLWLVLREGFVLVAAGLAIGFLLAAGTGRLVSSLLYEVNAFDPLIFSVAPLLLAIAALLACYIPARRAAKVVPVTALRME
jgi:predicted permease